jgi:hypothetical protein
MMNMTCGDLADKLAEFDNTWPIGVEVSDGNDGAVLGRVFRIDSLVVPGTQTEPGREFVRLHVV